MFFNPEEIKNLEKLLRSPVEDNIKLAFAILEGKVYPEAIKALLEEYEEMYNVLLGIGEKSISLIEICLKVNEEGKKNQMWQTYNPLIAEGLFKNIKVFNYYPKGYEVKDFQKIVNKLVNLEEIEINTCEPSTFSGVTNFFSGTNLPKLRYVKLEFCRLSQRLFEELAALPSLETLCLKSISGLLQVDFAWFAKIPKLKILDLSENDLSTIDLAELSHLKNLGTLYLRACNLTQLPAVLIELTAVYELNIVLNPIEDFTLLSKIPHLLFLNLGGCELTFLPPILSELTNLSGLYLGEGYYYNDNPELYYSNDLSKADFTLLGSLTDLETLYLQNCNLTQVSTILSELTNLEYIYFDNNNLSQADFTPLANLKNLKYLALYDCNLNKLPTELLALQDRGVEIDWY